MRPEDLQTIVQSDLTDCDVHVEESGGHYTITVVGEVFEGLRSVKRQQMVYASLKPLISDGSIHAVNIRAMTPAENTA